MEVAARAVLFESFQCKHIDLLAGYQLAELVHHQPVDLFNHLGY